MIMVDLTGYGPVSVMILKIDATKDPEHRRQNDPSKWSFDYQILVSMLGRTETTIVRRGKMVSMSPEMIGQIIAIDPIGDNTVALYWQSPEEMALNERS